MNTVNFQQTGGFPLETNTLEVMQTAYNTFNALGELAGDKTIIKGCIQTGNTISDGILYVNGEVIEFRSGLIQNNIIIREDVTEGVFENGDSKPIYHNRYAKFGTGAGAIPWADFKRIDPMLVMMQRMDELEKKTAVFQQGGGMLFWNKPANLIPAGWQEVVDWRGRFPAGMDVNIPEFDTLGKEGGEKEVTLTVGQLPEHTHNGNTNPAGNHRHGFPYEDPAGDGNSNGSGDGWSHFYTNYTDYAGQHTHSFTTNPAGSGEAHTNLPPYRVALFIEYIG